MTAMVDDLRASLRFVGGYARIALRNSLVYRADLFIKLAGYPARLVMAYALWRVLMGSGLIQGYAFSDVLTYYLTAYFLTQVYPFLRMAREIRAEIHSGEVIVFLARGVPHWTVWVGRFLAAAGTYTVLVAPVAVTLIFLLGNLQVTFRGLVGFVGLAAVGMVIKGQLWYLVGISSYYTEDNMGAVRLFDLVERFLSGAVLPLFLFPDWFVNAQRFLPFGYTLYLPVQTLLAPPTWTGLLGSLSAGVLWWAVLAVAIRFIFVHGWRRFSGHGV